MRDVYHCSLAMQMGCFGATTISGKLTGHDGHVPATVQGVSIVHRESRDATYTSSRGRTCQHTWKTNRYCVCDFLQPLPQKSDRKCSLKENRISSLDENNVSVEPSGSARIVDIFLGERPCLEKKASCCNKGANT